MSMKSKMITCPVCGQGLGRAPVSARCSGCGTENAFLEYFSSGEAFREWTRNIQIAKAAYLQQRREYVRSHGRLIVGPEYVAYHDAGTGKLTVASGNSVTESNNVQGYSVSNLHQLTLSSKGTVTAKGDSEAGQNQVAGLTDIVHVLAAPRCSYFVAGNGNVTARGACAIKSQIESWNNITALACGTQHLVGLRKDGTVVQADYSVAGRSSAETAGWKNVTAIAAAGNYTLGLHADGTVSYAGPAPDARQEVSGWRNVVAIAADYYYAVGLTAEGNILLAGKCVPFLDNGRSSAAQWSDVVCIAAGYGMIAGLDTGGKLLLAGSLLGDAQIKEGFSRTNPAKL